MGHVGIVGNAVRGEPILVLRWLSLDVVDKTCPYCLYFNPDEEGSA